MLSEEEKQAIEYLKRHIIPCYGKKGIIEFMLNDTLLNLIEKQQEELNKEKEKNKIIREKIEEKYGKLCMKLGSYVRDEATSEQERIAGAINELGKLRKELLEE